MSNSALLIVDALEKAYPNAECELNFGSPFQLLVAVILSAQCTDKRVNEITHALFAKLPTAQDFVDVEIGELEKMIYSCGFYRNKAKNIKSAARDIIERFGGEVPSSIDELVTLAGVGRKTANVVFGVAFGGQAMPVDTHVFRVSHRLGLAVGKTPDAVERELRAVIPEDKYTSTHHAMIFHGRYTCKARNPLCEKCELRGFCSKAVL